MFEFELEIMEREGASDNVSLISSSGVGHADVELPTWIEALAGSLDAAEARPLQNSCNWGARRKAPTHHREGERAATQDVINLEKTFASKLAARWAGSGR